jgi:hypothetical protein
MKLVLTGNWSTFNLFGAGTHVWDYNKMRISNMKKILAVVMIFTACMGWMHPVQAQDGKGVPVEFFACNWQDGKGMADLEKVGKKFSQWADKNDTGYSAWILTPQFHSAEVGFDVGWLGSWPSFNDFGKGQDTWMAGGRELGADFGEVIDCQSHGSATSAVVNAPDGPPDNGVVMFAQCTLQEGKSPTEALPAHRAAGKAMKAMGSKAASWLFFPGMGSGDIDFHYWSVLAFKSYSDLGAASEMFFNGGGWEKVRGTLAPVSRCRSPAVFDARLVRAGAGR